MAALSASWTQAALDWAERPARSLADRMIGCDRSFPEQETYNFNTTVEVNISSFGNARAGEILINYT